MSRLLVVVVFLALALSGCGGGEAAPSSGSGGDSTDASRKTVSSTVTAEAGKVSEEVPVDGGPLPASPRKS